jgi:tRNA A-37 threonylcarbamoyl transferase component Bud32
LLIERLGESLDDRIGEDGDSPLDLRDSVNLLFQLSSTVERMHARGVLHGDVQDRNVLSDLDASWVLIDPTLPELSTYENGAQGGDRDVFGVAKTFLSAYYGVHNYDNVPEDQAAELEDHPELLNLLRRMLGRTPPSMRTALRVVAKVLRREFADPG